MITTATTSDILLRALRAGRMLEPRAVDALAERAAAERIPVEVLLLREGLLDRARMLEYLENHFFCPAVDVRALPYDPALLALLRHRLARRHLAFPVERHEGTLRMAFADPDDRKGREAISAETRLAVAPLVALASDLQVVLREHYDRFEAEAAGGASGSPGDRRLGATPRPGPPSSRIASARSAPTLSPAADDPIKAADQILRFTAERGATDIHLQRDDHGLKIRLRTDGLLHTVATLPAAAAPPLISRMKVLASMDIAERRLPQDGRFTMHLDREDLDVRVSSLPSQFGEKIVIRLLRKSTQLLQLDNLQLPPAIREAYQDAIDSATGFFLVTGPTGSGKTTTLYATLNALDRESLNITTLEDPIEYSLPGLTQVQIREDIELSFASGLRSILRQDPDVILVGEIRDLPTVEIACRAALTGHKVFSTLHTNDACQAVTRLLDMGVAPHLIAATLRGVLAQRLVRKICPECRTDYAPNETERAVLGHPPLDRLQYGQGCAACAGSGYRGRVAVFEYFRVDEPLRRLIMDRASPYALRHAAARNGMVNMAEFARRAALDGVTTVAEIQRAVLADDGKDQFCSDCQRTISIDFSVCPFCKHVLKGKCQNCAAPIEANWQACPSCGEALARDWERIYCRHCLAPVQPAWSECHYCGGEL